MGAYFCPHCGNKTMIKVLAQTAADGTIQYRPLSNKQFSHKGLRVSVLLMIVVIFVYCNEESCYQCLMLD